MGKCIRSIRTISTWLTVLLMIFGCTGMILLTGALIQFLTITQIRQILGSNRMQSEIEKLKDHVIVVGFGRIGYMLARELKAAGGSLSCWR